LASGGGGLGGGCGLRGGCGLGGGSSGGVWWRWLVASPRASSVQSHRVLAVGAPIDEDHLMKKFLKILAALVTATVVWAGCSFYLYVQDHPPNCSDTLTLTGDINNDSFVQTRECLARLKAEKKTFVVAASGGGDGFSALAIAILLHRHNWDVEVVGICASSCANWIFPAGKTKYLNKQSMLLFHGGPHQKNMLEFAEKIDHGFAATGAPVDSVKLGRENKEGYLKWSPGKTAAYEEVLEFLSIDKDLPAVEKWRQFTHASDKFYQELGVNPLLPEYGQRGGYEPLYNSDKYGGFIYRLDSLGRLGIRNIELKDGEWHPERHPDYGDVYEVTYP
jgi:hypothetical protein